MTVKFIADIAVCLGHARRDINQFLSFFLLLTFSLIVIDSNVILVYVIFLFFF